MWFCRKIMFWFKLNENKLVGTVHLSRTEKPIAYIQKSTKSKEDQIIIISNEF